VRLSSGIVGAALAIGAVLLDQLTKLKVREGLEIGRSVHVFGPVYLTHVENTGSVFGIGQGYVIVPTIATIAILIAGPIILW
jgi:signal peptidase II